ncbi:adenylyltransferase/cytidyltransferase family protein [bacterium]|nr:adenylyltransferase/cytidyltransferase family protein [bacterium]
MNKIVITSGYFNPLHKGHLELFYNAKEVGDVWVIVNNDHQRELKGSKEFMDEDERLEIITALKVVDIALLSIDKDKTQCATLKYIGENYGKTHKLYFANGGDQNNSTISEVDVCNEYNITLIDGLGDKIQSSSWLLKNK